MHVSSSWLWLGTPLLEPLIKGTCPPDPETPTWPPCAPSDARTPPHTHTRISITRPSRDVHGEAFTPFSSDLKDIKWHNGVRKDFWFVRPLARLFLPNNSRNPEAWKSYFALRSDFIGWAASSGQLLKTATKKKLEQRLHETLRKETLLARKVAMDTT